MVTVPVLSAKTQLCVVLVVLVVMMMEAVALNGPNVCMVKQKYNITKRVKYRAPMSVRTYEWCMSIPPRCSKWSTEMRDLTRLETEERTAEVAVCCPGYKMKDVSCVPICPNGKTGHGCSQECPPSKWGPNCVHDCKECDHGSCSSVTGECECQAGWQGESCELQLRMSSTTSTSTTSTTSRIEELLTQLATKPTLPPSAIPSTTALIETTTPSKPTTSKITSTTFVTTSTPKPTTVSTTSQRNTIVQSTKPMTTIAENIPTPKKDSYLENTKGTSKTTERSSIQTIPTTTLSISTTVTKKVTTATSISTILSTTQTPKIVETTTMKPTTKENIVIKPTMGQTVTETTKYNKESNISGAVITATTALYDKTTMYHNVTLPILTTEIFNPVPQTTHVPIRTDPPKETKNFAKEVHVEIKTTPVRILKTSDVPNLLKTTAVSVFTETPIAKSTTITEGTTKLESSRRPDATIRYFPTTVKFKPKEIWIRPAQKGQETFIEAKKINHDLHNRHRFVTNKELTSNTTPKTIIVSIIPTSVSYSTFKKIALSTASALPQTTNVMVKSSNNSVDQGFTKPMSVLTTLAPPPTMSTSPTITVAQATKLSTSKIVYASKSNDNFHKIAKTLTTLPTSRLSSRNQTMPSRGTNSMTTVTQNLNSSNSVTPTVSSTNIIKTTYKPSVVDTRNTDVSKQSERVTRPVIKVVTPKPRNVTLIGSNNTNKTAKIDNEKTNATKTKVANAKTNKMTTTRPDDEETFHILTEPEHITAVMDEKGKGRTSVDLISVISIAGGIMMAVITVAVVIVMVERCRRPRYEDVRKMNDIHMQVMIDSNDVPPPYVRSIFHTPLPDPPPSEKCHYQPISTLDRNLKQFMRPVVVQAISPIMLENFREILECHYDHLPRRSNDYEVRQKHCSIAPSNADPDELAHLRPCSIAESTIDALKCEAKLDVLDSTTSEPLYAEIPCWRPPSEHAIEVMNFNGEAVTEL